MGVEEVNCDKEIIKIQREYIESMKCVIELQHEIIKNKDKNIKDMVINVTKYFFIFLATILITLFVCSYCFPSQNINVNDNKNNHSIEERE